MPTMPQFKHSRYFHGLWDPYCAFERSHHALDCPLTRSLGPSLYGCPTGSAVAISVLHRKSKIPVFLVMVVANATWFCGRRKPYSIYPWIEQYSLTAGILQVFPPLLNDKPRRQSGCGPS